MSVASDLLRERLVFVLDIVRKRWLLFCIPVVLASLLSAVAMKLAPTKYTANSLILLQAANRSVGGSGNMQLSNTLDQVLAVEAWLKSDQVLAELVPQMSGYTPPSTPVDLIVQMRRLAGSLSLQLVSGSVLEVKLESRNPKGLGRNLEIILSRIMEGLTGPEKNIFSAPQFVHMRRSEDMAAAEAALMRAIEAGGFQAPLQVRAELHQLWAMTRNSRSDSRYTTAAGQASGPSGSEKAVNGDSSANRLRRSISDDPKKLEELERLYAAYQEASDRQAAFQVQAGPPRSNYVSIFSSPEDLLIIGRPQDPIAGQSAAHKLAVGAMLMSVIGGCGVVLLAELFNGLLRTRREFESASGLPVVARLTTMPGERPAA